MHSTHLHSDVVRIIIWLETVKVNKLQVNVFHLLETHNPLFILHMSVRNIVICLNQHSNDYMFAPMCTMHTCMNSIRTQTHHIEIKV